MLRKVLKLQRVWSECTKELLFTTKLNGQVRSLGSVINTTTWEITSSVSNVQTPTLPLHSHLWNCSQDMTHLTAIECFESGQKYTYGELKVLCNRVANGLQEVISSRDYVGIILPNTPQFVVAFLACLEAGIPVSFYNPRYTCDELIYQINRVGPKTVICDPSSLNTVIQASQQTKTKFSIFCTKDTLGKEIKLPEGVMQFEELYQSNPLKTKVDIDMNKISLNYFSGGTTGMPKAVAHTNYSLMYLLEVLAHNKFSPILQSTGNHQDVVPVVLPLFHIYGNAVIMAVALAKGAKLVLLPKFSYQNFVNIIKKSKPTVLYFVPPLIFMSGTSADITKEDMKQVRSIVTAAAPCSVTDMERLQMKAPIPITQKYGCSEGGVVMGTEVNIDCKGSSGILFPNTRMKILDIETKKPLPPNREGELVYTGPQRSQGYLNDPEATKQILDSEGWIHSGDVGYYDEDGHFFITDRIKDVMKVKGYQVSPSELEAVLRQCPGVLEAAVVGVPDKKFGEAPVAAISVDKTNPPSVAQLEEFTMKRLTSYKKISKFVFVDEIPKTMSGKILRREIRKMLEGSS